MEIPAFEDSAAARYFEQRGRALGEAQGEARGKVRGIQGQLELPVKLREMGKRSGTECEDPAEPLRLRLEELERKWKK